MKASTSILPVLAALGCAAMLTSACASIGPKSVSRDRFDYNGEVARSWQEQTLLNIVKARYVDVPVFLDVSQILSGYTLQSGVTLGGTTGGPFPEGFNASGQAVMTDRPTITYTPLTGAQFNRNMLTPVPPSSLLFTIASGWPADLVFRVATRSINGVDSSGPDAPRYDRLLILMRELQEAQALGMQVLSAKQEEPVVVMILRRRSLTSDLSAMVREVQEILGLQPGNNEYIVTFGQAAAANGGITMHTRSILQVLRDLGEFVEVPEDDVIEGRTLPSLPIAESGAGRLRIKYSEEKPRDALVLVKYRDGWFWIDDRDLESKSTFGLVMLLTTLTESGAKDALPLVTIPTG